MLLSFANNYGINNTIKDNVSNVFHVNEVRKKLKLN